MKILGLILGVALCFLANTVRAQSVFAGFDDFCGLPVVVAHDPQGASARTDPNGQKFIHIDPGAMANWTASRIFLLAHECAHHRLGHTNSLGTLERYMGGTAKQELEADCWAAEALSNAGYDNEVQRTANQTSNMGHFASPGYPTGTQRSRNILKCAGRDGATESATSCRNVSVPESYIDYQTVIKPVTGPCQHCGPTPYGYRCMHAYDVSHVPMNVPVSKTRMVSKMVCD
jgi:hypothetical protein